VRYDLRMGYPGPAESPEHGTSHSCFLVTQQGLQAQCNNTGCEGVFFTEHTLTNHNEGRAAAKTQRGRMCGYSLESVNLALQALNLTTMKEDLKQTCSISQELGRGIRYRLTLISQIPP